MGTRNKIYRKEIFNNLPKGLVFLGHVDEKSLPIIYSGAEGLVYPSYYEGFGLPVLEAMACGVPVIVSNTSALTEVVGEAGLLVDPTDIAGIADHMQNIYFDPDLKNDLIKVGFLRAANFSWDSSAQLIWDILQGETE